MIKIFNIKNYRNLEDFSLKSLGQINLITGKNNTGKSTILEAISLFVSKCDLSVLSQILGERGESLSNNNSKKNKENHYLTTLSSLFFTRKKSFREKDAICFTAVESPTITIFAKGITKEFSLRFVRYIDDFTSNANKAVITRKILDDDEALSIRNYRLGFEIKDGNNSVLLPLNTDVLFPNFNLQDIGNELALQYIKTRNIDRGVNGKLFDNIALTEKESYVIDALRIIEPDIERLAFVEDDAGDRNAVVKLKDEDTVFPLKSMGDGINRILTIILGLVNSSGGYVLIDEFENGLHFSIQYKLWRIIFDLSRKLEIQVFATTHSDDCIRGFERVLNLNEENQTKGHLIRLDKINRSIREVVYSPEDLKNANRLNIETR